MQRHVYTPRLIALILALLLLPALGAGGATVRAAPAPNAPGPNATGPTDPAEVGAFFDQLITRQLAEQHIPGATVAVVKDDALLFAKGYGYADVAAQTPVDADRTLFFIGSAGKTFTWTAVMQLVEQGKIDLHADVNRYLDFRIPATYSQPITMANLLTHTAGFEEQYRLLQVEPGTVQPLRDVLISAMPARVFPPGKYFAYSNYGTALAGYIVQRVSGEPFEQYITNHILTPLGMTRSAATEPLPPSLAPDLAKGYRFASGAYEATDFDWLAGNPAGPIRATATDMAKFMRAHLNDGRVGDGRILQAPTAQEMQRQQFTNDPSLSGTAYGYFLSTQNGEHIVWHDGESAHFVTILGLMPERHIGVFVSYNGHGVEADDTLAAFVDHYYPSSAPAPQAIPDPNVGRFAGTYIPLRAAETTPQQFVGALSAMTVSVAGASTVQVGEYRYVETEPGLFRQVGRDVPFSTLRFATDERGQVTHLFMGPLAFAKAPWYRTLTTHLIALGLSLLLLLSAAVAWPLDALIRRLRHRPPVSGYARLARWVAAIVGPLTVVLLGWFVVRLLGYAETYIYPAGTVMMLTGLLLLVVPLTVGVVALAVLAWRRRYWNLAWRVHYTALALASVGLVVILNYWHLLGPGA